MTEEPSHKQEVRNTELFRCLKDLANSFMDALDKPFIREYGSWYDRVKVLAEGNSGFLAEILMERPDLDNKKLSKCLIILEKCLEFIIKQGFTRQRPHASTREDYREELTLFLAKLLEERERLLTQGFCRGEGIKRGLDEILNNEYSKYEIYLYDDSVSDFLICPIDNFVGSTRLDLGHQLMIREITHDEFRSLVEFEEKYEGKFPEYSPEIVFYIPTEEDPIGSAELGITSLRLLKNGKVGLSKVYHGYAIPCKPWEISDVPEESRFLRNQGDNLYTLSESENKRLVDLFSLLVRAKSIDYLSIAMRRFNFAYNRDRLEDKWIDYFVSLESLYSKRSDPTEVTHRISTRVSRALADSLEDRKRVKKKIKDWYGIRSSIVHGTQDRPTDPNEVEQLEDTVRKSIKWFISREDCANHDEIIDELDLGP